MAQLITVQTMIDAGQAAVWEYFTRPEHITRWYFADDSWHCPSAENDLQNGGRFNYRMEAKDGSGGFDFAGTYTDVSPMKQLKYRLDDGRVAEVAIQRIKDDRTSVAIIFEAEENNPQEIQKEGWQAILDNFKKYVLANN